MQIIVNAKPCDVQAATLAEALSELGYAPPGIATAVNGSFVPQSARADRRLQAGDRLLIYSDGFECAFPDEEHVNDKGKRKVANENYAKEFLDLGNGDPTAAFKRLEDKLDEQAGSLNQKDDLTVLCLAVSKEAGNLRLTHSDVA